MFKGRPIDITFCLLDLNDLFVGASVCFARFSQTKTHKVKTLAEIYKMLKIMFFGRIEKNLVWNDVMIHVYTTMACRNAVDISFVLSLINGQVGWSVTWSSEIIALINEKYKPRSVYEPQTCLGQWRHACRELIRWWISVVLSRAGVLVSWS